MNYVIEPDVQIVEDSLMIFKDVFCTCKLQSGRIINCQIDIYRHIINDGETLLHLYRPVDETIVIDNVEETIIGIYTTRCEGQENEN